MTRLLATLLILMVTAPSLAWAAPALPGGLDLLGSSCCAPEQSEDEVEQEQAEMTQPCCCKPSHVPAHLEGPPWAQQPGAEQAEAPVAQHTTTSFVWRLRSHPKTSSGSARAPPRPSRSLFDQHISLLL